MDGGDELLDGAHIGHGSYLDSLRTSVTPDVVVGDIGGDIDVSAGGDLTMNGNFAAESGGLDDAVLAQIGHGATVFQVTEGNDIDFGRIQGDIDVTVNGALTVGASASANTTDDRFIIASTIGHGSTAFFGIDVPFGANDISINHGSILGFDTIFDVDAAADHGPDITVRAGSTLVQAVSSVQNNGAAVDGFFVDNAIRSQIGHSPMSIVTGIDGDLTETSDHSIVVTENRIAGDITIYDTNADDDSGVTVSATIAGTTTVTNFDLMTARIGHAGGQFVDGLDGGVDGFVVAQNASNVTILQAHILGADILVDTITQGTDDGGLDDADETNNQDISVITSITAGNAAVTDSTAVAQIGHGSDTYVRTGDGAESGAADTASGDGGDITIVRGTVWDGDLVADDDIDDLDDLHVINTTDITILSSNEVIVDSDTSAALASTLRSNAESQIGHGFKIRLDTGDGGSSNDDGTSGGAGGDVLIYQGVDRREYGIDNDQFDDYAYGIRGDIRIVATELDGADGTYAISVTSDDSSALAKTDYNSDFSTIGHGDVIEITTGNGGDGGSGRNGTPDDNINDPTLEQAVYGGRGGHIDVSLGRTLSVDQGLLLDVYGASHPNVAAIGDFREGTSLLTFTTTPARGGVSLTEGDISIEAYGTIQQQAQVNNALSPADHAISESVIGHSIRMFADSGDGGNGGEGNYHTQYSTVYEAEQDGEQFLNYDAGQGSNRGGNGGDIRLTFGDITDRNIWDSDGNGHAEIHHDTDADNLGHLNGSDFTDYLIDNGISGIFDVSSDISIRIHDTDGVTDAQLADSLIITAQVNAGTSEGTGADIQAGVGHHVRLFAEAGAGGAGGWSNTEFDDDGNSLYADGTNQTDTKTGTGSPTDTGWTALLDGEDGYDETAGSAGAVFNQPDSSGGRGGDGLLINGNIAGDIMIDAARRVTVQVPNGHGEFSKVFASLGHTTHLVVVTQDGGNAGNLREPDSSGTTYDGGIINVDSSSVSATQNGQNDGASEFDHVLVDGNSDDEFDLSNIGDSQSTDGEDGIAVTPDDIDNRTGSTFKSIKDGLGTLEVGVGVNSDGELIYVATNGTEVIFHDEEADPNFIIDNEGNFVLNTEINNQRYAENLANMSRFGRVVAAYDGADGQPLGEDFFNSNFDNPVNGSISLEVFVDMDRDGDVDLVDFDRDGRLDIVDVDHDGRMDVIDGRANYVTSSTVNEISGLGVLDYVAVTGVEFSESEAQGNGTNWSTERELTTTDLLAQYNNEGQSTDFTAFVSDFATANGGRGGDAYTQVGYSAGDISISTGNNDMSEADSLVVMTNVADGTPSGSNDILRANIGHAAFQISDASGSYIAYRAGREGLDGSTDVHVSADGGDGGYYAVNGNGGRGGNAFVRQGAERDVDPSALVASIEYDHLVGNIWVNTSNALDTSNSSDAGRVSFTSATGGIDAGANTLVTVLGHSSIAASYADNTGGNGASDPHVELSSSQTELADGGDGGDASVLQRQVKGTITLMTGSDDLDGSNDQSVILTATNTHISGGDNTVISQFGHGRIAVALGGEGGIGDDGQLSGNGGNGGDAEVTQESILDTGITVDLLALNPLTDLQTGGYDGNGMLISASSFSASDDIIRAQVGHGDLVVAIGGDGGDATKDWDVNEQRNQTANGGDGGDAIINQAGYNYDITLDIGSDENGGYALQILSDAGGTNNGSDDHILAVVGHGGYALAVSGSGGDGGLSGAVNGIQNDVDPNLTDSDYDYSDNVTDNGDTPYAIDIGVDGDENTRGNGFMLGTDRNGGHAGDAVVNIGVGGTGANITGRDTNNDYGINDTDGANISITTNDRFDSDPTTWSSMPGYDGILIQTKIGPNSNQNSSLDINSALVGHHGFGHAIGGAGGQGIQSGLSAQISEGDGGDGGSAIVTSGAIRGDISVTNAALLFGSDANTTPSDLATNIVIETISDDPVDSNDNRGEARIGHLTQLQANAGDGADSAREAGDVPSFPATVSAQGGDGGDALTYQGQLAGDISVEAENSVLVRATDGSTGGGTHIAAIGHRTVGEAFAGNGAYGGTYNGDSQAESAYFTYEALREFHARRTAGATDEDAFNALSEFEQKLVAPVVDYFENKEGELEIFLDHLVGDEAAVIASNDRDDDFVGGTDYTIPGLVDGQGHIDGADDGEIETLSAILAASGHGGNAIVVQGSTGLDGVGDELSANGDISITAHGYNADDADRGIIVEANAASLGASFEMAHIGHQAEAHEVVAGYGQEVNGRNAGANGIGGDGGDAVVDQYAQNGGVDLVSDHKIRVSALDPSLSAHEVRAWIGHRLTVGADYTEHRSEFSVVGGKGGDEQSVPYADGHNGNGGDVFIYQRGVISGTTRNGTLEDYDTEISLAALQDADDVNSITIEAVATGTSAPDVETHIGHDFLIQAAKAGDAGRQASLSPANGAAEGLLEGNGGDIFIAQTDLGADIDIVGRDQVLISADSTLGNHAHLMIGHERTIGNSAELDDTLDGGVADNPRTGEIIAGYGGDAYPEDVNGTALSSRVAAALGIIEDGDSGRIEIGLGQITDSFENEGDDNRLITITSITEDVDILSRATNGAHSILEIGNQQQLIAETLSAAEYQATPFLQTAGDAGGIYINRATISGDILVQAIDADRASSEEPTEGKQVVIDSTSGAGATSVTQIGHETQFTATAGTPVTSRAAFGEDRNFLFETNLQDFVDLDAAGTGVADQATLRDAQNAVEDMENLVQALELAMENADRFPEDDNVAEVAGASADQGELFQLLADARQALAGAKADLANIGSGLGNITEVAAVNNVRGHADELITAATDFQTILDSGTVPEAGDQIADFAEGGDIVYGALTGLALDGNNGLNSHTSSITGVASLGIVDNLTIDPKPVPGALVAEGFDVTDTGLVEGNVDILSGRDSSLTGVDLTSVADVIGNDTIVANNFGGSGFTAADDLDDSVVQISATAHNRSLTEIGHRRIMINTTEWGGGDTDGAPEAGGVAGDGGSIVTQNSTVGNVTVQAEEVAIYSVVAAGESEVHLLHSSHTTNTAGWSDLQSLLGNGGDIINTTMVSGGVAINAEQVASAVDAGDRKILASGLADSFIHLGHQAEDKNDSESDRVETGNQGDGQGSLGSNRGGFVTSNQSVTGNGAGNLVSITLDAAGDGSATDLILETAGTADSDIRLGNGEDGNHRGILNEGLSGVNQNDDGGEITLTQVVSGDISISSVEDFLINVSGTGDQSIYIGHDAEQFGQSGEVNSSSSTQYGERVTVNQSVSGNISLTPWSSLEARLATTAGELHVGHEATQEAYSADDSGNPTDFDPSDNGASFAGVNDSFERPDVLATQTIDATVSVIAGDIRLTNDSANRLQFGHEAFHLAAVDGDLTGESVTGSTHAANPQAGNPSGFVVASSLINGTPQDAEGNLADIVFAATGDQAARADEAHAGAATMIPQMHGIEGDITLEQTTAAGEVQVGHRSISKMTDGPTVAEGFYNTLQGIGSTTDADSDGEVDDTSLSVIQFTAAQDIELLDLVGGTVQVGHYITETGDLFAQQAATDGNAVTGVESEDSLLAQIVGSDILFGDNPLTGADDEDGHSVIGIGGTGTGGAGNNLVMVSTGGRSMIGHMSPDDNRWQVEGGTRSVTAQLLDGDIIVEAGTDAGTDAPDGMTAGQDDETGTGDDILLDATAGGIVRIGHNQANALEGNETQVSAGDIWVRSGGDLHVLAANIGHEDYDFDNLTVGMSNATPEGIVAGIRDRIHGNTYIGAGQNSAVEDSISTVANVMVFDDSAGEVGINSGYGGQGDADVDGELRFFLPAQENLRIGATDPNIGSTTVSGGVVFNDSRSNVDDVYERGFDPGNIFTVNGGNDHEHDFEFMSETAPYTDTYIGLGNFTFYFEEEFAGDIYPEYTPYIDVIDLDPGFSVLFTTNENGFRSAVNIGSLSGQSFIGTSSLEVLCEEMGGEFELDATATDGRCVMAGIYHEGYQIGFGSNVGYSATAGGNQAFDRFGLEAFHGMSGQGTSSHSYVIPADEVSIDAYRFAPAPTVINHNDYGVVPQPVTELPRYSWVDSVPTQNLSSAQSPVLENEAGNPSLSTVYGEYVGGEEEYRKLFRQTHADVLSEASSYTVFDTKPL
jgi:hypothetical protein